MVGLDLYKPAMLCPCEFLRDRFLFRWRSSVAALLAISALLSAPCSGRPANLAAPPASLEIETYLDVHLLWAPSADALEYRVYRSLTDGVWDRIGNVPGTRFVDKTLVGGHSYRYRVTAISANGVESAPSPETLPVTAAMQIREIEDYNYDGGKHPGFFRAPYAAEAPAADALDAKYDYFYQYYESWVSPNPYRADPMVVVDEDPDPTRSRHVVAWTFPGDWWRYTFDVGADGWVKLVLRAGTPNVAIVNVFWDEQLVTTITCHSGDWSRYDDFPAEQMFQTSAGRHTLRLELANASANLDLFGIDFAAVAPNRRIIFQDTFEGYSNTDALNTHGSWTVLNTSGDRRVAWSVQDTISEPRSGFLAGVKGRYVVADSGQSKRARVDETLISPVIDCRGFSGVRLRFSHNMTFNKQNDSTQNCDVDIDVFDEVAGQWSNRWTTVFHRERDKGDKADSEVVAIGPWADGKWIRLRWRFYNAKWDRWWALDNVQVSGEKSEPLKPPSVASIALNGGAASAADRDVQIQAAMTGGPSFVMLSERGDFAGAQWQQFSQTLRYTLSQGVGSKTVYLKAKNAAGESASVSATISYAPPGSNFRAARTFHAPAVFSTGYIDVAVEVSYTGPDTASAIEIEESLPLGWIFDSVVKGPASSVAPARDAVGTIRFRWDNVPLFPYVVVYRVRFAGEEFARAALTGEARVEVSGSPEIAGITGANSLDEVRSDQMFHRVLYHATVISSQEWDWIADSGFTLVHSYGGDPYTLRQAMDEAHQRGIKMVPGSVAGEGVYWMRLSLDSGNPGAPTSLRFDVRHHYTDPHPSLVLFATPDHPLHMLQVPLENPAWNTISKLAAHLNSLGYGLSARVEPGKESMSSELLATWQYGDLAQSTAAVWGSELRTTYRRYVEVVKDHPALFCLVPFDDADLLPLSPNFQRYVGQQVRQWAPGVPVYIMPTALPTTFAFDHRIDHRTYDGIINYIYPGVLPDHVDVLRTELQERWNFHRSAGLRPWLFLGKAFSFSGAEGIPPKGSLILQWEAAQRSGVPLTGFGFYAYQHDAFAIAGVRSLQQESREVNRMIKEEYFDVRIEQDKTRIPAGADDVTFSAKIYGGHGPYVLQWDFGDGKIGWGERVKRRYEKSGEHRVKLQCLDSRGVTASTESRVYLAGVSAPVIREDFEDGIADNFAVHHGAWTVESGRYIPSLNAASRSSVSTGLRHYSIATDMTFTTPGGEGWIIWSGAAENGDLRLSWQVPNEPEFTLKGTSLLALQTDSGVGKAYVAFDRKQKYHVVVDVFSDMATVSVDGVLVIEQPIKSAIPDGVVGVGANSSRVAFDNFAVAPLPWLTANILLAGEEPLTTPYSVKLTAGSTGGKEPLAFRWDFGDGSTSTVRDPQHVYAASGAWKVHLLVTDPEGQTATASRIVITGGRTYYREAEDYDWTDGAPPGYPIAAEFGVKYGAGQRGRKGVDYYQLHSNEGELSTWRDGGSVSLYTGKSDTGINIHAAGATDWWNYTFQFPAPGVARVRAFWGSDETKGRKCQVLWKGRPVGELIIPGNGDQNYALLETPSFSVDGSVGQVQFRPLDWGLSFARFEVIYVPSPDSDADGIADVLDVDSDNDGFANSETN